MCGRPSTPATCSESTLPPGRSPALTSAASRSGSRLAGGSVWVIDNANATVIRLDPSTLRAIGQPVSLPAGATFYLGASDGYLFIADDSAGTVTRIDTHTGKTAGAPIRIAPASTIGFGSAYAIAPAGTSIWATSPTSDTISRIQTKP